MASGQGESRLRVIGDGERRGRKPFDRMAGFTRAAIETASELSGMGIGMAIGAQLMGNLLFEIAAAMAFLATDVHMFAAQREIRQIMIEPIARHALPSLGAVAARTVLAESAAMRILMARRAIAEIQAGELRKGRDFFIANFFRCRFFAMALRASRLLMAAG